MKFLCMLAIAMLLHVLIGCARAEDPIEPIAPSDDVVAEYDQTVDHLLTSFVYGGFGVVSRTPAGEAEHLGEALIWGGTALWVLPCDKGQALSEALAKMILDQGGALIRVDPIGEYANGRQITLDGALGAFLGIARRVVGCGEAAAWREPIKALLAFQEANGDRLHPEASAKLVGEFKYLRDLIAYETGVIADGPGDYRLRELEKIVGGWAGAVQLAHGSGQGSDACYRVNLGLTALLTAETFERKVSDIGRDQFCANTNVMDIPTVDHWCGRKSITEYLASYEVDLFEYRHQRCGAWESPDGKGNTSPRLDKLVAMVMAHGWLALQR